MHKMLILLVNVTGAAAPVLAGCIVPPGPAGDGGADGAAGKPLCSFTPAQWRERCEQEQAPALARLCAELEQTPEPSSERVALALSIEASDLGITPAGFGELRFRTGTRWRMTLREWAAAGSTAPPGSDEAREAAAVASDANRNFELCTVDLGALGPPASAPVCYVQDTSASGPTHAECAVLDGECGRGRLDEASRCCTLAARPAGVPCPGGACDGAGSCVAMPPRPPPATGGVIGSRHWVERFGGDDLTLWYADASVELRLDGTAVAALPLGREIDLARVRVARRGDTPFGIVGIDAPAGERTLFVPRLLPGTEVCVARGRLDRLGTLLPDCSSRDAVPLDCPSDGPAVTCAVEDDRFVVRGKDVSLAWQRHDKARSDVHTLIFPAGCIDLGEVGCVRLGCSPPCLPGQLSACRTRCGRLALRGCNAFSCPGPCASRAEVEVCDGIDNDCDGAVDEATDPECDDGVPCTLDRCRRGRCRSGRADILCSDGPAACSIDVCDREIGTTDPRDTITPRDFNGCSHLLRHGWCTDVVDGCDCNGAERCVPGTVTLGGSGCVTPPRWDPATSTAHAPCESDHDNCTLELCCEDDWDRCRAFRGLDAETRDAIELACNLATTERRRGETGRIVHCGTGDDRYASPPDDRVQCELPAPGGHDGNPCTQEACAPATGACVFATNAPDGSRPGCDGVTNRGCARYECAGGTCNLGENGHDTTPIDCSGRVFIPVPDGEPTVVPTCAKWTCRRTTCEQVPDGAQCDDGLWCTGAESCTMPVRFEDFLPEDPGGTRGCVRSGVPCTTTRACVLPSCTEPPEAGERGECHAEVRHALCPLNPVGADPCTWRQRCDELGDPATAGCEPVLPGGICDDGDACTDDSCASTEFLELVCTSTPIPECVGQ